MKFIHSPLFLFSVIAAIILIAATFHQNENKGLSSKSTHLSSSSLPRKTITYFFKTTKAHDEAYIEYLAPVLEKYYLQRNITREETLDFSRDWWNKYPYEKFEIDWDNAEESDLGNGNTYFRAPMNYCKGRTSQSMNCKDINIIVKVNQNNQIYYLADR